MQKISFFIIETIQKYPKCPALRAILCKGWLASRNGNLYRGGPPQGRAGTCGGIFGNFSYNKKCNFCIFCQVILTEGRLFQQVQIQVTGNSFERNRCFLFLKNQNIPKVPSSGKETTLALGVALRLELFWPEKSQ